MPDPIRILFIIDYFHRTGGTERHLAQLVRLLSAGGVQCAVVVFDLGPNLLLDEVRAAGIPVFHVPVGKIYTPNALWRGVQLARLVRRGRIEIVQTFHQKSDTYGAVVAKLAGVRHIVSSKRDTGELKKPWYVFLNRRLRRLFDRYIVVAEAVGRAVATQERVDPARMVRIYNGVDATRFSPPSPEEAARVRADLGFGPDDFVLGMVAGFRPEKDHELFFQGALRARQAVPSLKILAVGAGPLLGEFRARYGGPKGDSGVVFSGDVPDVERYLKAMDVGCLLPRGNEGFSNAVVEKMAAGLPVIVTDVGGNAEAVIDGENGFVMSPGDLDAFARAVVELYSDPDRRRALGRASRRLVEERYSLESMRRQHEDLYFSLCR